MKSSSKGMSYKKYEKERVLVSSTHENFVLSFLSNARKLIIIKLVWVL